QEIPDQHIDKTVPAELDVHVVCDNLATHKTPIINQWLARHPRFHVHYTPTGSSWNNQVDRWFTFLNTQFIQRGVHKSAVAPEKDVRAWIEQWNANPPPFAWCKPAEESSTASPKICNGFQAYTRQLLSFGCLEP
ncbi:transposase, partial [Nocardia sp. NPDC059239]|uniref:transposase n=1 Tax=Nocardia sp. NPDC059239 TaxID=3346785 RepID=UPI00369AEF10